MFIVYVNELVKEMRVRKIKYQEKYYSELLEFCDGMVLLNYPEHDERYLKQCFYNLQEKYDRGIITKDEYLKVLEVIT